MKSAVLASLLSLALCAWSGLGCAPARERVDYAIKCDYSVADPQFTRVMGHLLGPPLIHGNRVDTFVDGDQFFPAMLEAMKSAKHSINFETYIFASGDVGGKFVDAMAERARAGVQVRMIIDAVGSDGFRKADKKKLTDAGVKLETYHAVEWYNPWSSARLNNRTHRKLLIVDGQIGFTGGACFADDWNGTAQDATHWHDLHYRATGPIVAQLQAAFNDNWMKTSGEVLNNELHFPEQPTAGNMIAQTFKSGPDGGAESMELMFLLSLGAARKNIRIENPYFIPSPLTSKALQDAVGRGVTVQVIVPGPNVDNPMVKPVARSRWGELLKKGVQIYEYQPALLHCKLLVVDDLWVSVGSANLDNRSFRVNDEANLNVMDQGFAAEQIKIFQEDLTKSKPYTYEQWKARSFWKRVNEALAETFTPLL
jgi:cardiolipin synthase